MIELKKLIASALTKVVTLSMSLSILVSASQDDVTTASPELYNDRTVIPLTDFTAENLTIIMIGIIALGILALSLISRRRRLE